MRVFSCACPSLFSKRDLFLDNIEQRNKEFRMKKLETLIPRKVFQSSDFPTSSFEIPCLPRRTAVVHLFDILDPEGVKH
jgi:hypothetical protein